MCTIVVLHRVHPEHPLVVAANRDEFYDRPALPPRRLDDAPGVVAGVDCEHGGTWMGVHASGLFVGITNQRTWGFREPAPRSRGRVALDALATGSSEGVRRLLRGLDPSEYNSFNLLWGDARGISVAYARRDPPGIEIQQLAEGMHVLANERMDSPDLPKTRRVEELVRPVVASPWDELIGGLCSALADHERPPPGAVPAPPAGSACTQDLVRELQAVCVHTPAYGTRSSTIVALGEGRVARYLYADGPPCRSSYADVTSLVDSPPAP